MFAARTDWDLIPSHVSKTRSALEAEGVRVNDLTEVRTARCGLGIAADEILGALADPRILDDASHPLGIPETRAAVAGYYADRELEVGSDDIVVTASRSEAFSHLFELLLEADQEVAVPVPSYPLFDSLARLADVRLVPYPQPVRLDVSRIEEHLTDATRALFLMNPNVPSGALLDDAERDALVSLCKRRDLALIVDEAFMDYASRKAGASLRTSMARTDEVLTFTVGTLSKALAIHLKMGWIVVSGPTTLRTQALRRLEVIADTYSSASRPNQIASIRLLAGSGERQAAIRERLQINREWLTNRIRSVSGVRLASEPSGWYATLGLGKAADEEGLVLELLEGDHVLVHPGYLFEYDAPCVVVSLLPPGPDFQAGIEALLARATTG